MTAAADQPSRPRVDGPAAEAEAPESLAEASLTKCDERQYYPSPKDWREVVLYSIVVDRFQAWSPATVEGDPVDGCSRHGGNLRGLSKRLDYIRDLGGTAIHLTPVALNGHGSYHGYAPRHLMAVDPRLGTMEDLRQLVSKAHERGIRVVLDLVLNHAGPVFEYADGSNLWRGAEEAADVLDDGIGIRPLELAAPQHFSRRGVINDWNDTEQETLGDFPPDYRRLATENPDTQHLLRFIACWWVRETDIDGIRLDAVRHMDRTFVATLCETVRRYAGNLGKDNFLVIGEHAGDDDTMISSCFTLGLNAVYNYGEYRRQSWALHGQASARELEESFDTASKAFGRDHGFTIRFIDNHDVYRFLRDGEPAGRLRVALAHLILSIGIPMLYYGTEQGFRQSTQRLAPENLRDPADPENRQDMFPEGRFTSPSSEGDSFDGSSPFFRWTRRLIELRGRHRALRLGEQEVLFSERHRPGIYAFMRHYGGERVLVVLNTDSRPVSRRLPVDALFEPQAPIGREPLPWHPVLLDLLLPGPAVTVQRVRRGPLVADITLPAFGVDVFLPSA
ncbi:alpha-amylase family glycosyl hydrolase [Streptomyces lancefieldiae]|uniref:Alpha-amylase n=1 Tax=Streptomyces lancefieldiae TaxID=3075520 RepID=A0ABU3AGP6_9ACTN|nr:alpha-amylase family glycosyl hydrolase [Streptomyces sp. DSM 40712]MDT0609093.1 alpha-amylase family glycosyl hydrolase [Streptomyces sp. DSM 40712]